MEPWIVFAVVYALLGLVLALVRPRQDGNALLRDSLMLFFLATAVCDLLAALGGGSSLAPNAYALAAGYLIGGQRRTREPAEAGSPSVR